MSTYSLNFGVTHKLDTANLVSSVHEETKHNGWSNVDMRDRITAIVKIVLCVLGVLIGIILVVISAVLGALSAIVAITGVAMSVALFFVLAYNVEDWWQDLT